MSINKKYISLLSIACVMAGAIITSPALASTKITGGSAQSASRPQNQGVLGIVTAVNGTTITMTSKARTSSTSAATIYTVDASSATVTKNGANSSLSAISVGDTIIVGGSINGTTIKATTIRSGMGGGQGFDKNATLGTVTAVNGTTITMTSKERTKTATSSAATTTTYTVDASSATVQKDGTASAVSSVAVGDTIIVKGTVSGTTITATSIQDGQGQQQIKGNGEPVVGGAVTAISGNSLTITNKSNLTYTVDASSATVQKDGTASAVSSVAVGDNVVVQGTVNGTSVTATSVIDQGNVTASKNSVTPRATHAGGFLGGIASFFEHLFGF